MGKLRLWSTLAAFVLAGGLTACQGMDRLEPDRGTAGGVAADDRGTLLDATAAPEFSGGGRITEEIAARWIRQIQGATGEERLALASQFLREYPAADYIASVHELVGDAESELGRPERAAAAWERAIAMSWPEPDILGLPLTKVELPYQVGWAHFEAGDPVAGADWLVRAGFISDRPQLDQGLRFMFAGLDVQQGFDEWVAARRDALAVQAPDFELPGFQTDSLRLSDDATQLTLINFWTPT